MESSPHIPVLLNEVLKSFEDIKEGVFVDCTLGFAGHSYEILKNHPGLKLIGIDRDEEALNFSRKKLAPFKERITLLKGSFSQRVKEIDFESVTALLADFGVSLLQLDSKERGFSFESETLDMRMDKSAHFSAADVVNSYTPQQLEKIFREFGEVKEAKKVANAICKAREQEKITSSKKLAQIIADTIKKKGKTHPATQVFQAIRIEVNRELDEIVSLLDTLEEKKPKNGIIALITFHSLEDRLVKQRFKKWAKKCICPSGAMRCACGNNNNLGEELTKKPLTANSEELKTNPRSRSAKLRVFKFKG